MPSWPARHPELAFSPIQEICINKHVYRNSVAITKIFEGLNNFYIHRFGYKIHLHLESNASSLARAVSNCFQRDHVTYCTIMLIFGP